jgi:hypothetical protein
MKIGLSFSRCLRDIFDGKVSLDEVLVVIARTNFDPTDDAQWNSIWNGYYHGTGISDPEWSQYPRDSEPEFREIAKQLWSCGKLHQPRRFGARVTRRPEIWLETVLMDEDLDSNPLAKQAWDGFKMAAALTGCEIDREYR